jgi:hypothetical protein
MSDQNEAPTSLAESAVVPFNCPPCGTVLTVYAIGTLGSMLYLKVGAKRPLATRSVVFFIEFITFLELVVPGTPTPTPSVKLFLSAVGSLR